MALIANPVTLKFALPEGTVRTRGRGENAPPVAMPETAVNEHNGPMRGQHEIGSSRKIAGMQAVAKTSRVQIAPHRHLRLRVSWTYASHHAAAD